VRGAAGLGAVVGAVAGRSRGLAACRPAVSADGPRARPGDLGPPCGARLRAAGGPGRSSEGPRVESRAGLGAGQRRGPLVVGFGRAWGSGQLLGVLGGREGLRCVWGSSGSWGRRAAVGVLWWAPEPARGFLGRARVTVGTGDPEGMGRREGGGWALGRFGAARGTDL
jgi:hypothetical protein